MIRPTGGSVAIPLAHCFLVGAISLTLSVLFWQGTRGPDDLTYASLASHVLEHGITVDGNVHYVHGIAVDGTSHHVGRIGVYLPLAAAFRIFGVNEFSLALIPLLSTVLTSALLYLLGAHLFDARTGLLAGLLYAFFPLTCEWCNVCFPEPMVVCELSAAAILYVDAFGVRSSGHAVRHDYRPQCQVCGVAPCGSTVFGNCV